MKKRLLIFLLNILLGVGLIVPTARADKEGIQKVLKKTDQIEKVSIGYLKAYMQIKQDLQKKLQGIKGVVSAVASGDIAGAISSSMSVASDFGAGENVMGELEAIQSNYETGMSLYNTGSEAYGQASSAVGQASGLLSKANGLMNSPIDEIINNVPSFIQDVNDLKGTMSDIEKNVIPSISRIENPVAFQQHEEKINDILREKLATLYAQALVTRSKIADEKAATPEEIDTTNERALISAAIDSVTQVTVRLNNIYQMESAMMEYQTMKESGQSGQRETEE